MGLEEAVLFIDVAHAACAAPKMSRYKARDDMDMLSKAMTKREFVLGAVLPPDAVTLYRKVLRQGPV